MTSSWEQAGREAACPGEAVTFTCTAQETLYILLEFRGEEASWVSGDFNQEDSLVRVRSSFTGTLTSVVPNEGTFHMTAILMIVADLSYNGSTVKCSDTTPNPSMYALLIAGDCIRL